MKTRQFLSLAAVLFLFNPAILYSEVRYNLLELLMPASYMADSLNNYGQIAGCRVSNYTAYPIVYDSVTGNITELGGLPGSSGAGHATAINNKGQIVGDARNSNGATRAVLFDPT